ncbi:calcium-binding protein [Microseira sp. BLCC-F43]|uniref:calcium-binding protein n=1 Tax=Microseira sp. BLCC-F43 TaxID=3153602 RepID=UPI0035BA21B1
MSGLILNRTSGNNTLNGSNSDDIINSGSGNDIINGFDGNDILNSGSGNDTVNGGAGNDIVNSGTGNDTVNGGAGNDILNGGSGNDVVEGGAGNDILNGGSGNDFLSGGSDFDIVNGGSGNDNLDGGDGDDFLTGGSGSDLVGGAAGNDIVVGADANIIKKNSLVEIMSFGTPGRGEIDTLIGGLGADQFILGDSKNFYYDDGKSANPGNDDYALIVDFNGIEDKMQLKGSATNYSLARSGLDTRIVLDNDGIAGYSQNDELIAIVQGNTSLSLSSNYFVYV